jgi:hypothetical protein
VADYVSYLPYLSIAFVALGVLGLFMSRRRQSAPQLAEPCEIVADWRPTGKIDFVQSGRDDAPRFNLQSEDFRVLQSMSGTKRVEVRWRPATLEEAKRVASWNNSRDTIFSLPLPQSTRTPSLVPALPHEQPAPQSDEQVLSPQRSH